MDWTGKAKADDLDQSCLLNDNQQGFKHFSPMFGCTPPLVLILMSHVGQCNHVQLYHYNVFLNIIIMLFTSVVLVLLTN